MVTNLEKVCVWVSGSYSVLVILMHKNEQVNEIILREVKVKRWSDNRLKITTSPYYFRALSLKTISAEPYGVTYLQINLY